MSLTPRHGAVPAAAVTNLGGNHAAVPASPERPSQDSLGFAVLVHVRRVENVQPPVEGQVHDAAGLGLVGPFAEHHGADHGNRDRQKHCQRRLFRLYTRRSGRQHNRNS